MIRKNIAKYIGLPLQDMVKRTSIIETLNFLRVSQFWDETRINEYQLNKLRNLIDYASRYVPYYEEKFKKIKLSSKDIMTLDDIHKVPILTKEILRNERENLVSRCFPMKYVKKGKTGGTTGPPVIVYKDIYNRSFTWASYYRWYEWMGLNYYDSSATFWGAPTVLSSSLRTKMQDRCKRFIQNTLVLNSFNMNEKTLGTFYKSIINQEPTIIKGYLSSLLDFAKYIDDNNLKFINLKAISSTTETLLPHNREYLEEIFGVPIFDQYGCGEISAISYECSKHNGLHIQQEHVICEILDDMDNPMMNSTGRVVATDLDNWVMPFIRYENGDFATLTDIKCTCGVNQPLMESIEGRSVDTITLKDGSKVHGVFFTDIFYEIGILTDVAQKFQVYQEKLGAIDFKIQSRKALDAKLRQKLIDSLLVFFDIVNYSEHKILPKEKNGKFKYIINTINHS